MRQRAEVTLGNATTEDVEFILYGIKDICRIEGQKPSSDRYIKGKIRGALGRRQIRVARVGDRHVGFFQYKFTKKSPYGIDYGPYNRRFCWIEQFYVAKGNRRRGIGDLLQKDIVRICKKQGVKEVMLDVFRTNGNARKFYDREKFSKFIYIMKERIR